MPYQVASSRTVNSFKNCLDEHCAENPPTVRVNCAVAIIDAVHNSREHKQSLASVLMEMDLTVCPTTVYSALYFIS